MVPIHNHRERQFMKRLRGRSWVKAFELPEAQTILNHLLEKRWIESQGVGRDLSFRITEAGLDAKKAPIPLRQR
jgi:hypothetical protein